MKYSILSIAFSLFLGSCGLLKKPAATEPVETSIGQQWTHMSASYQCEIVLAGNEMAGTMRVKMKRDSILWFSIKAAFGLQVAKGVITGDSAHILNTLQGEYYALPLEELEKRMQLPAKVSSIQKLWAGEELTRELEMVQESKDSVFQGKIQPFLDYFVTFNDSGVESNRFVKKAPDRTLTATYTEFTHWSIYPVASKWDIAIEDELNTVRLKMQLKNVSFDNIPSYPFRVPEGYKRVGVL